MKASKILIFCLSSLTVILLFFASCKKNSTDPGNLYIPSVSDTTANASLEDLQKGRELYINNCGECHSYYIPESLNKSQWQNALNKMVPKTNLSSSEADLVEKYLTKGQ